MKRATTFAIPFFLALFLGSSTRAPRLWSAPPKKAGHVKAALVAETTSLQPGHTTTVGLRLDMEPHWHTYWINAGESGTPTSIHWSLPTGYVASSIQWPSPEVIAVPPVVSYGYSGTV